MGDIAVDVFLKTLKQLITSSKLSLIISEKNQLQSLEEEIKYLREFLKVTEKKRKDHSELMELVMQIRDLVSKAENIVELFVGHAFKVDELASAFKKGLKILTTIMKKIFGKNIVASPLCLDLGNVIKGLKILTIVVKKIYDENIFDKDLVFYVFSSLGGSNASKVVKQKVVVGFEEEVEKLIDKLDDKGEGRPLEIISIIGAGGGGKTTLAREVYDHRFTSYTFDIRVWIDVSQDYDKTKKRDLLIGILESAILKKQEDYGKFSDDQLGEKGSKVMFTSRLLVELDCVGYVPHYLAPLPTNWCWELLQKKVFGMEPCPPELADVAYRPCNEYVPVRFAEGLLARTPNLRKLGLHRWSREKGNVLRFPDIEFLNCLEKLTFTMASHSYSTVGSTLPPGLKLPLTITQITMKHTCLKWEELSLLQALPSLEVLKLINNACIGAVWDIGELEGFPELKYLRFSNLDIKEWNASEDQFPKLEYLVLIDQSRGITRVGVLLIPQMDSNSFPSQMGCVISTT
ncbi:hypothetical protein Vadar_020088 [Vaccinium darrowii]|uniref:Uncharacterized protein n=1 Tax=Vaccinium darrowii TaxID=229202 RepID=A0ACB7Y1Q8_9ERIC|nr:hypothetical protein Vadar_020088 [Vaccinium darrowii]